MEALWNLANDYHLTNGDFHKLRRLSFLSQTIIKRTFPCPFSHEIFCPLKFSFVRKQKTTLFKRSCNPKKARWGVVLYLSQPARELQIYLKRIKEFGLWPRPSGLLKIYIPLNHIKPLILQDLQQSWDWDPFSWG